MRPIPTLTPAALALSALLSSGCGSSHATTPDSPSVTSTSTTFGGDAVYVAPADNGLGAPPPTLATQTKGGSANGSDNDVGYCHEGYCIEAVVGTSGNGRKIKFNQSLVANRNDPNLHQVLARAFHPYYVTKDESLSTNDCPGGWRLCAPQATYDMAVRKISSCSKLPEGCTTGAWTFQMLHAYLWANQVASSADHCGDAEGNIVVIQVDSADPTVAFVWHVKSRDESDPVVASKLDFTGAHPQFVNNADGCGIGGCSGSHHKQYTRKTDDKDAHNWTIDQTTVFFHPGVEYDYKRNVAPLITCEMPAHGDKCHNAATNTWNDEGHDNDQARCGVSPYSQSVTLSTSTTGASGPWGANKDGAGAFYGGLLDNCPLTSDSAGGWGIGLNVSWSYSDSGVRGKYPIGDVDNTSAG
ncbi:hypothetical protein L6R49_01815 [Myxococcota bacterium]|nr:hypothetical protein [Myxococcota bacterium]